MYLIATLAGRYRFGHADQQFLAGGFVSSLGDRLHARFG